jgi:PAS domain S-box-containing protein/putative nucleotidyltransferase with HDIG domain
MMDTESGSRNPRADEEFEQQLESSPSQFASHARDLRKTVQQLRESEQRFRAIFDSAQDGILVADGDTKKFVMGNHSICRMLGYSQHEIQGLGIPDIHPAEVLPYVEDQFRRRLAGEAALTAALPIKRKDGSVFYAEITTSPLKLHGKTHLLGIFRDITERVQSEEALTHRVEIERLLASISTEFVTLPSSELDRGINDALRALGEFAAVDRVYVFRFSEDAKLMTNTHEWCAPGIPARIDTLRSLAIPQFPWWLDQLTHVGSVHVPSVDDLPPEASAEKEILRSQHIQSVVVVALAITGSLAGFIGFNSVRSEKTWSEEDIRLLRLAGQIISGALARQRSEEAMRLQRERLEEAQRTAHLGSWEWDIANDELHWSRETYRIFGRDPQRFTPTFESALECVHPADRKTVKAALDASLAGRKPYEHIHRVVQLDGSVRFVRARAQLRLDAEGKPDRLDGTMLDITDLEETEDKLRKVNRALETISAINAFMVRARDEAELVHRVCRVLIAIGKYRMAWIGYAENDEAKTLTTAAHAGYAAGYVGHLPKTWADTGEDDPFPAAGTIRKVTPTIVGDIAADGESTPWRKEALKRHYRSVIVLPLFSGEHRLGALALFAADVNAFDPDEVRLLGELSDDLAYGLRALRERQRRRRVERDLKASERRLREIIENEPDGVAVLDQETRIQFVNRAGERLFGRKAKELLGAEFGSPVVSAKAADLEIVRPDRSTTAAEMRFIETEWMGEPASVVSLRDVTERRQFEQEREENAKRLERTLVETIQAVALAVEKRDPYTAGHQRRVADLATAVAEEMGLSPAQIEGIRMGSLIHDVGKIYVPAEILVRPGKLSDMEFEIVKSHPEVGYDIVRDVECPWPVADMILQHHERLDGSGYPRGLKQDQIMLEARILTVSDVVEAMHSHRPYRASLGMQAALDAITRGRGVLYDPAVVDACVRVVQTKGFTFQG